jgi:hypothetical protein
MIKPLMMLQIYRPKVGQEEALFDLVKKHWPAVRTAGLATADPPLIYRATDKRTQRPYYVEIFSWTDANAPQLAHQMPEVMAIWEPMGPMIENGPSPELAVIEPVSVEA